MWWFQIKRKTEANCICASKCFPWNSHWHTVHQFFDSHLTVRFIFDSFILNLAISSNGIQFHFVTFNFQMFRRHCVNLSLLLHSISKQIVINFFNLAYNKNTFFHWIDKCGDFDKINTLAFVGADESDENRWRAKRINLYAFYSFDWIIYSIVRTIVFDFLWKWNRKMCWHCFQSHNIPLLQWKYFV